MSKSGTVEAVVKSAAEQSAAERKIRQLADLQQEIASEEASAKLMDERKKVITDRIAKLKTQLVALQG